MQRLAAVGVLLAVEVLVGLQTRIVGVAELSGLFIGRRIAGLRAIAAGLLVGRHHRLVSVKGEACIACSGDRFRHRVQSPVGMTPACSTMMPDAVRESSRAVHDALRYLV